MAIFNIGNGKMKIIPALFFLMGSILISACSGTEETIQPDLHRNKLEVDTYPLVKLVNHSEEEVENERLNYFEGDTILLSLNIDTKGLELDSIRGIIYAVKRSPYNSVADNIGKFEILQLVQHENVYSIDLRILVDEVKHAGKLEYGFLIYYKNGKKAFNEILANKFNFYYDPASFLPEIYVGISEYYEDLSLYNAAGPMANYYLLDIGGDLHEGSAKSGLDLTRGLEEGFLINKLNGPEGIAKGLKEFNGGIQSGMLINYDSSTIKIFDYSKFLKMPSIPASSHSFRSLLRFYYANLSSASYAINRVSVGDKYFTYLRSNDGKIQGHGLIEITHIYEDGLTSAEGGSDNDFIQFNFTLFKDGRPF